MQIQVGRMLYHFKCCKKIVEKYGSHQIHLYELALADCPGQLLMTQPTEQGVVMHGLSRVVETPENTPLYIDVRALCLDEIPECQPPHQLVAIKIDVENHENEVLEGAKSTILRNKPIIFLENLIPQHIMRYLGSRCLIVIENVK